MLPFTDSTDRAITPARPNLVTSITLGLALGLGLASPRVSKCDAPRIGAPGMLQPHTGSLLVGYYEAYLRDQDPEVFRHSVSARYNEGTLARVLQNGEPQARRASVLALGLFGSYASNAAVARGLRDPDSTVRALASDALWAIWFRADSPENNEALRRVQSLINRGQLDQAIDQANALIARSPNFAEAYNQRAIAHCFSGRFAESIDDCRKVLVHNPFHTGALGGMGQCQLRLGQRHEALDTFRRSLKLQPYSEGLKQVIAELEAEDR